MGGWVGGFTSSRIPFPLCPPTHPPLPHPPHDRFTMPTVQYEKGGSSFKLSTMEGGQMATDFNLAIAVKVDNPNNYALKFSDVALQLTGTYLLGVGGERKEKRCPNPPTHRTRRGRGRRKLNHPPTYPLTHPTHPNHPKHTNRLPRSLRGHGHARGNHHHPGQEIQGL